MRLFLLLIIAASCTPALADDPPDGSVGEQIITIPKKGLFTIDLETTLFRPKGEGPFPLAVINHGKAFGNPKFQPRYRPMSAVRYFLQRGYVVAVPMRQGFAGSKGSYMDGGCNLESNGLEQATDVAAVLDYVSTQAYVDRQRIVMIGQSHGGFTTLALGATGHPGVLGLVNFAGGPRYESCTGWERILVSAVGAYGAKTKLPSLWFYGDNESYFTPATWKAMRERYTTAGGQARLVAFGTFSGNAHSMFGSRAGEKIWQPEVSRFLQQIGLPTEINHPEYSPPAITPKPEKTDFAPIDKVDLLPHVGATGREGYSKFLLSAQPRAFALAPSGAWGWAQGEDDPLGRALANCNQRGSGTCRL